VRTILGSGKPDTVTPGGGPAFFEPGGLSVAGDELFVADTNNHRIVRIHLKTHAWCEVVFEGLSPPRTVVESVAGPIRVEPIAVAADRDIELVVDARLPADGHLNPEALWSIRVSCDGMTIARRTGKSARFPLSALVPATAMRMGSDWIVEVAFAYCTGGESGLCIPQNFAWSVPIKAGSTSTRVMLSASPESFR